MPAQLRVLRRRIRSVQATKKITRAMELISASRIVKAQARVNESRPYAEELTRALTAAASKATVDHPLVSEHESPKRAVVILVTSDRGLAGAYSSNVLREGEALTGLLRSEGKEAVPFLVGRKAVSFYRFRGRSNGGEWTGFSDAPKYSDAKAVADAAVELFLRDTEAEDGVDEVHIVYTEFVNMVTQRPVAHRILPLVVEETTEEPEGGPLPLYEFEPSAEQVLDALLPKYVVSRVWNALLQASASEHAARRRAMKAATDNADELVKAYTREANAARQAAITQEISEIVGGANALADATAGS
ncbi:ATP synthase F1 subcomplex gamma subunit [Motilibacter rhizosphaerae]|uniref:ATP synthase gamma chain n=1 Tax=Motilibacter rhizosphaerae TaxID=598652 RepID=A0A4Q7NPB1_9ACTN|nr:F0F1 ATP synthase subunit gamma [Motilibacter rhizosphaerae]RZS87101.1 ATP synthase F1 subcomplex gamma subunit [Motilibacter rhizosphaerae]